MHFDIIAVCAKCRIAKPIGSFPKARLRRSGHDAYCFDCKRAANRLSYEKHRKRPPKERKLKFQKLSDAEWQLRKAATRERQKQQTGTEEFRAKNRLRQQKHQAALRYQKALDCLRSDIDQIRNEGVTRKKPHFLICPVIRYFPELYRSAQRERKRLRENPNLNPERRATLKRAKARRRSRFIGIRSDLTARQWAEIKAIYSHRCAYCGERKPLTQDHITPISKGGEHTASNIVPACQSCNSRKGARLPIVPFQPHLLAAH
jgi:5-methylcytosine-specific restriction endonuclease McrA